MTTTTYIERVKQGNPIEDVVARRGVKLRGQPD